MLNFTEHKISTHLDFKLSGAIFIMLINVKMPTTVDILTSISMINLSSFKHILFHIGKIHMQIFTSNTECKRIRTKAGS